MVSEGLGGQVYVLCLTLILNLSFMTSFKYILNVNRITIQVTDRISEVMFVCDMFTMTAIRALVKQKSPPSLFVCMPNMCWNCDPRTWYATAHVNPFRNCSDIYTDTKPSRRNPGDGQCYFQLLS